MRRHVISPLVVALVAMTVNAAGATPAAARPAAGVPVPAAAGRGDQAPVPARPLATPPRPAPAASAAALPAPVWPAAAHAVVTLAAGRSATVAPAGRAVRAVVSVAPATADIRHAATADPPSAVDVRVIDRASLAAAGNLPVGVVLTRADGGRAAGPVRLTVDYSGFATAYGGGYAARLRLATLPACALTTPKVAACTVPTLLPSTNDTVTRTVTGTVQTGPAGSPGGIVVLDGGTDSTGGDYRATDLSPTGAWSAATGSGDFTYHYPIALPPPPYGSAPPLSLDYDSQSVDGLTSATNNEANPAGLGWTLSGSYVERHYRLCSDDGGGSGTGDLCWDSPNSTVGTDPGNADYTIVLNGVSSELVKDPNDATVYHMVDDPGWIIQHLTGLTGNGDDNGEFWVVTVPDGTHYWFGYGARFTDHTPTNSVDAVPVFGNNIGEPCYTTGTLSPCTQAYRWNLDLVQDPNEVDTSYMYVRNTNNYYSTMSGTPTERGYYYESHLTEIDYGYAQSLAGSGAGFTDKVVLGDWYRCTDAMAQADPLHNGFPTCPTPGASPTHFPDVPVDFGCAAGDPGKCASHDTSPVFFSETMLTSITTYTLDAAGTATRVAQYELKHSLHDPPGSVTPFLQLDYVQREGFAGTGAAITLPTTVFSYTDIDNTLAGSTDLEFGRLTGITSDTGGHVSVTYGTPDACVSGSEPDPASNTKDCYRFRSAPSGGTPTWAWYRKELVTQVQVDPGVGFGSGHDGDPVQTYTYTYAPNTAAWRFPADPTQPRDDESWTEWRGYQKTTVTTGSGTAKHTSVSYMFQGINGDRKIVDADPNNPADWKSVTVHGTGTVAYVDQSYLPDRVFEEVDQDASGVDQVHVIHEFWTDDIAPYPGIPDGRFIRENKVTTLTKLSTSTTDDSTWRSHVITTNFDTGQQATSKFGLPVSVYDQGLAGVSTDDSCTTHAYAIDTAAVVNSTLGQKEWYALPDDVRHYGSACPGTAGTQDSQVVTLYDGAASEAANSPYNGNATKVITSTSATATVTTSATYDAAGRAVSTTSGNGKVTTIAFSPVANWPASGVTTTTPAPDPSGTTGSATGLASTVVASPYNGAPTATTDPNGHVTTIQYDTAGRLINVWNPDEPTSGPASVTYAYTIPNATSGTVPNVVNGPTLVTTGTLQATPSTYLSSSSYDDGLGRERETQMPAVDGSAGRDVTSTRYDDAGNGVVTSAPFFASGTAGSGMVNPAVSALPSATSLTVDWAGRTTESTLLAGGVPQSRGDAVTSYPGADMTSSTDPDGNVTDQLTDVFGQVTSVVQHTPLLTPTAVTTGYTYTDKGQLASVTDAAGHQSTYSYDWTGARTSATDPDTGATSQTYDADGNVVTTTDNKGQLMTTVYDAVDRPTAVWKGASGTGSLQTSSGYDVAPGGRGKLASSTSYNTGAKAYVDAVDGYDAAGRATGTTVTIPTDPTTGLLAGAYDTTYQYDLAGHQVAIGYPAVGSAGVSLPAETVTTAYTAQGEPSTVSSTLATYVSATGYANYGPLTSRTYGAGSLTAGRAYTWNQATGDLTGVTGTVTSAGVVTTAQNDTYTRDNAGNLLEVASSVDGQQQCFAYDSLNRLTGADTTTTASPTSCAGAPANHTGGPSPYDLAYHYDQIGDITSTVDNVTGTTNSYSYNDPAHVHAVTDVVHTGGATGHDTYGYNLNGDQNNRNVGGAATSSTWTAMQQLATMTTGASTTTFLYDADGDRLMREAPGDSVLYLPGEELHFNGATVTPTRYYAEAGAQVALRVGGAGTGTLSWTMADAQGSAQLTVNASAGAVTQQRYLPFGAARGSQGPPVGTNRSFLGRPGDPSTGLIADGARYYDPTIGRFTSPDPLSAPGDPQGLDAYSYAGDNPTTLSDPSGLTPQGGSTEDHSTAIMLRVWQLAMDSRYSGKALLIHADVPSREGADLICYNCVDGKVLVWEFKAAGQVSSGVSDLTRHINGLKELQATGVDPLLKDRDIVAGDPFDSDIDGTSAVNDLTLDTVTDGTARGVQIYHVDYNPDNLPASAYVQTTVARLFTTLTNMRSAAAEANDGNEPSVQGATPGRTVGPILEPADNSVWFLQSGESARGYVGVDLNPVHNYRTTPHPLAPITSKPPAPRNPVIPPCTTCGTDVFLHIGGLDHVL